MAWVYLDDQFPDHPKVVLAGGDAAWLFVCGLAYCRRHGTDGFIPGPQVPKLSDRKAPMRLASKLVEVGLWDEDGEHFRVHDYADWNRSSESRSAAGRKAARARWGNAERNANASESHSERIEIADASGCTIPIPNPSTSPPPTQGGEGVDGVVEGVDLAQVWEAMADHAVATSPKPIGNVGAFRRKVVANARREHHAEARRLAETFVGITPDRIAAALNGETTALRYLARRETA